MFFFIFVEGFGLNEDEACTNNVLILLGCRQIFMVMIPGGGLQSQLFL